MTNIYEKKNKKYLYLIIDLFLLGEIDEITFCDEYYYSYDLEIDYSTLTNQEEVLFYDLSNIVSRLSAHQEDHQLDPNAFTNAEMLQKKVLETKLLLHPGKP